LTPEDFRAPFTAAEGWGTYSQQRNEHLFSARLKVRFGRLTVRRCTVELDGRQKAGKVAVTLNDKAVPCHFTQTGSRCEIGLAGPQVINADEYLSFKVS
jgi:non-lysosomal glucosylceramidase